MSIRPAPRGESGAESGGERHVGRLFWKFFLTFWLSLLVASMLVAALVSLHEQGVRDDAVTDAVSIAVGPRSAATLRAGLSIVRHGGVAALRDWLIDETGNRSRYEVYAVDGRGRELLGRTVPAEILARARESAGAATEQARPAPRIAVGRDEASGLTLFVTVTERPLRHVRRGPPISPATIVTAVLLASFAFSALLAWYLTQPIRHLRQAFGALAGGALDTRVAGRMGRRKDELADLGGDFDRMAAHLEQLVHAQRRLLHDVSHELRSPLARLQAAIGIARQEPARATVMLERIERESDRIDGLVGELLTLARLDAGLAEDIRQLVDLGDLMDAIVDDARFEARASGRELHYDEGPERMRILGNAALLHRAFENVIRNALKFAPSGTTIDVEAGCAADGHFRLRVGDRGPGLAPDEAEAIFEPFRRARTGMTTDGYGLGLAIARRAIEWHGGRIGVAARDGGGLVVTIELPGLELPAHHAGADAAAASRRSTG